MIKLSETTYDDEDRPIQREPRWIRPFTNDEDLSDVEDIQKDQYIPDVLLDEIPEDNKNESDPDDPCMTRKEILRSKRKYGWGD